MAGPGGVIRAMKAMPGAAAATPVPQGNTNASYFGRVSPLGSDLANENNYSLAYNGFLPRPGPIFTQGAFGPFSPILPVPVDEPAPGADRPEPRRYQYDPGYNLPVGQPGSEGLKLADFNTLRTLADLYSVARTCIQLRKNEIRGMDWDVVPTHEASKAYHNDRAAMRDFGERRAAVVKFLRQPDPDYFSWTSWLDVVLEEIFVFDALSILIRPKRGRGMGKGLLGSDLDSLEIINGPTIRPLIGIHGEVPRPPAPAYQQYLYGVPRSDLMTMITHRDIEESGLSGTELRQYRGDQLLYLPMVPRRWTPYGFPPIERALIPVMAGLQKQAYQLDYWREGCYSDDTEILTRNGWKLFADLDDKDEVATRSPSGEFQWQLPSKRQCFEHDTQIDGPLVHFQNKSLDLLVTQNHRMLVKRPDYYVKRHPNCDGQDWHIKLAKHWVDNPSSWFEVPVTSYWKGSGPTTFELPAETGRQHAFSMPMDKFCAFLGLFLAEGWVQDRSSTGRRDVVIFIGQASHSKHLEEIKTILKATGLNWKYSPESRKFTAVSKKLGIWLKENCGHRAWNKLIPVEIKNLPPHCLEALLRGLMIGDGTFLKSGGRRYTTTSRQLADDVQEIFQKTGCDARIQFAESQIVAGHAGDIENRAIVGKRPGYIVHERLQKTHGLPHHPKLVEYNRNVYCVSVPNKIVFVRRNGKAAWCGNTVPAVYISPGDPNITPNQIRDLQDALNAFAGDPAWKHKIIVLPPGSKVDPMKGTQVADQFDEIVMSQVCMAFDVQPMELGIIPQVSAVASPFAAREMAQAQRAIQERKSTKPLLKFISDIINGILHRVVGQDDMKFIFEAMQEEADQAAVTSLLVKQVQNGLRSVDEAREELELEPWGLPETSGPIVFTSNGPMPFGPLPEGEEVAGAQRNPAAKPLTPAQGGESGGPGGTSMMPPLQQTLTPAHEIAEGNQSQGLVPPPGGKAAQAEIESLARQVRKGRDPGTWEAKNIPWYTPLLVANDTSKGMSAQEVTESVKNVILGSEDYVWSEKPVANDGG